MFQLEREESIEESTMVTNAELAKEVGEEKEKNSLLEEALEDMKVNFDEVVDVAKKKEE